MSLAPKAFFLKYKTSIFVSATLLFCTFGIGAFIQNALNQRTQQKTEILITLLERLLERQASPLTLEHFKNYQWFETQGTLRVKSQGGQSSAALDQIALHYRVAYTPWQWLFFNPPTLTLSMDVFNPIAMHGVQIPRTSNFMMLQGDLSDISHENPLILKGSLEPFKMSALAHPSSLGVIQNAKVTLQWTPSEIEAQGGLLSRSKEIQSHPEQLFFTLQIPQVGVPNTQGTFFATDLQFSYSFKENQSIANNTISWGSLHHPALTNVVLENSTVNWHVSATPSSSDQLRFSLKSNIRTPWGHAILEDNSNLSVTLQTQDIAAQTLSNILIFQEANRAMEQKVKDLIQQQPMSQQAIYSQYEKWRNRQFQQILVHSLQKNPTLTIEAFDLKTPNSQLSFVAKGTLVSNNSNTISLQEHLFTDLLLQVQGEQARAIAKHWKNYASWSILEPFYQESPAKLTLHLQANPTTLLINKQNLSASTGYLNWKQQLQHLDTRLGLPARKP